MSTNYRPMWTDLGLNLANHDMLMQVLGDVYAKLFMAQKNRPQGTRYLDTFMSEVHGHRIQELVETRKHGRKVIGTYCSFVPEEFAIAADAVMVGLCAGADFAVEQVEQLLPRNTCALIKSTFGFKLGGVCPYIEVSDLVIGENTCDGKKKAYEQLRPLVNDLYVVDMPQTKGPDARALFRAEYVKLLAKIEELTGVTITAERLSRAISIVNAKRAAVARLAALRRNDPSPLSGLDSLLVNQIFFLEDPVRFTQEINSLCDELENRVAAAEGSFSRGTPRILLSGCPMAIPNWKIPSIIESSGAVIVGEESCIGERGARNLVDTTPSNRESMIDAVVDRYFKIDCAIYSPNPERLQHIREMYSTYRADGVVLYAIQFCTPYCIEAMSIEKELEREGIAAIRIESDYSQEDASQLTTRIQAFIEQISERVVG